jgi:sterol 3beta-glucosyltransferase
VSHFIPPIRSLRPYQSPISWFLDNPELGWTPPQTLVDWIGKARTDGKPIVYIGFGSITVPNPKLVTERIIRGVLKSKWSFP